MICLSLTSRYNSNRSSLWRWSADKRQNTFRHPAKRGHYCWRNALFDGFIIQKSVFEKQSFFLHGYGFKKREIIRNIGTLCYQWPTDSHCTISSQTYAYFVHFGIANESLKLSDNYFDLKPLKIKTMTIEHDGTLDPEDFEIKTLKIKKCLDIRGIIYYNYRNVSIYNWY